MQTYRVEIRSPDGRTVIVELDREPTPERIQEIAKQIFGPGRTQSAPTPSTPIQTPAKPQAQAQARTGQITNPFDLLRPRKPQAQVSPSKPSGVLSPKEAGGLLGRALGVTEEEKRNAAPQYDRFGAPLHPSLAAPPKGKITKEQEAQVKKAVEERDTLDNLLAEYDHWLKTYDVALQNEIDGAQKMKYYGLDGLPQVDSPAALRRYLESERLPELQAKIARLTPGTEEEARKRLGEAYKAKDEKKVAAITDEIAAMRRSYAPERRAFFEEQLKREREGKGEPDLGGMPGQTALEFWESKGLAPIGYVAQAIEGLTVDLPRQLGQDIRERGLAKGFYKFAEREGKDFEDRVNKVIGGTATPAEAFITHLQIAGWMLGGIDAAIGMRGTVRTFRQFQDYARDAYRLIKTALVRQGASEAQAARVAAQTVEESAKRAGVTDEIGDFPARQVGDDPIIPKPPSPEPPPAGTGAKGTAEPPAIPSAQELGKTGRRAQANAHAPYVVQAAEDLKRRLDAAGIEYSENWGSRPGKQGTHGRTSVYIKVGDRTVRISDHISTSQRNMSRIYQIVPNKGTVTDAEAFLLGKGAAEPPTPPVKDQAGRRTTITDDGLISDARVPHTREVLEGTRPLTPKEFAERVDAYEKIARAEGVPIFKGVESRSFAGAFVTGEKAYRQGRIKMTDLGLESYASTLSHELAHAIDARITTSAVAAAAPKISKEAGRVRLPKGDLTLLLDVDAATAKAMDKSLREVTWALISKKVIGRADLTIGKALARENPSYYHRKNELWARFLESVAFHPEIVARYAPEALDKLIAKAASDPVLGDFIAVAMGKGIERGQGIRLLPDRRQLFIKQYGKYLGTKAYDAEVVALRRMQQQVDELTSLIKQKFKGVKDDPSTIFKAAEAIQSNNQGVKVFGTADRTFIPLKDIGIDPASLGKADSIPPSVIEALADWDAAGWKIDGISEAGEIILRRTRYTAEEGKTLYDSLSPQGKKLIDEFTATVSEARDLFNRHLFASTYNIKESIEGWVHHFWREKLRAEVAPGRLRERMASLRKRREGALGFAEDLKAATTKAYTEEAATQIWNEFVNKQIARLAEPLPKGSRRARHGYVTVQGNPEKGFRLYEGDIKKGNLWEVPKWVYEDYVQRRLISAEASQATQVVNAINQYWQVNALLHPGSVVLNAISGALQLVPRLLDDFFLDMFELSAKRTTANVVGLVETLTPRGWHGAPDWVIGGRHNTFVGQFQAAKSPIDKFADKGLYPFGVIERYFKKAIANAERRKFKAKDFEDPALIKAANDAIDIVAYDYNNIPHWLQNLKRHPVGAAAKPFATYPYKYTKQLFEFVGKAFDPNVPIRDRVARLFTIATMTTMYLLWEEWEKNASQYGKLSAEEKEEMGLTARHYVGKDSAGEAWLRTGQYPFVNAFDAVNLVAAGRPDLAGEMAGEIVAGVGPLGNTGMALFGYSSKYDRYQPMAGRVGESAQTYVPGFRLLRDIAELRDAGTRKQPTTFWEAFGRLYPTGDPELREQLAGERQIKGRLRDPQSYQEWLRLLSGVNIRNPKDNSKKPAVKKPAKK